MKNAYISFVYFNSVSGLDFTYYAWTERFEFYVNVYQCIVLLFIVFFNTEPKFYNFHAASSLQ